MTISSTTNRVTYTGNGVTTAFAVPFPFHAQADLVVIETIIATGVQTTKALTTHYTISGTTDALGHYSSGGTVNALVAPAATVRWSIYRDPARTQELDLTENNNLPAESVEAAIDYQTMLIQRVADLIGRSLRQPDGDSSAISVLPSSIDRASMYLAFDASGEPVATAGTTSSYVVTPFMETVLDDTTAAAARTSLGVPSNAEAILDTFIAAKGDLIVGTANDTPAILTVGSNGEIPMARSAAAAGLAYVAALTKHIFGLTYSNGTDATNDIDFAAGGCMDSTGVMWITCAAMAGKQLDANWAPGAAAGMRNSGAGIANTDYYLYAVAKADGTQDYYAHTSATVSTVITALQAESGGANYVYARIIGWIKRVGATIVAMTTYETEGGGLELLWSSPTLDVNLSNTLTTTRRTDAVKVPLNFSTLASLNVAITDGGAATLTYISCPDVADLAPSATVAPLANVATTATKNMLQQMTVRTSATGTIAARSDLATVDTYNVVTLGFTWARRN